MCEFKEEGGIEEGAKREKTRPPKIFSQKPFIIFTSMSTLIIKHILQGSLTFPPVLDKYTEQVINNWQDSGEEK